MLVTQVRLAPVLAWLVSDLRVRKAGTLEPLMLMRLVRALVPDLAKAVTAATLVHCLVHLAWVLGWPMQARRQLVLAVTPVRSRAP